jgi:predicted SprT family Zn-dependent metalloprotease
MQEGAYDYSEAPTGNGYCEKVEILKEERKQAFKEMKEREHKIDGIKLIKLNEQNKKIEKQIKEEGKIPNWYSCQICQKEFVTEEELKIVPHSSPICDICNGRIKVKEVENGEYN